ncbi:MAG: LysM peptidoglycan-binding domain-containing protein [Lachnospiraceae bacterium]
MLDLFEYISTCQEEEEKKGKKTCGGVIYVIKDGDTLYGISKKYQLKVKDILSANPYVDIYNLQKEDEICIPVIESKPMEEFDTYVIKEEDTILSILESIGLSFEELAKLNKNISNMKLPMGTVLLIPKKRK